MWHELGAGVEAQRGRVIQFVPGFEHDEPRRLHTRLVALASPQLDGSTRIREKVRPVDREQRSPLDANVPRVLEALDQPADVRDVVLFAEVCSRIISSSVPCHLLYQLSLAQHSANGKSGLAGLEHLLEGSTQHSAAAEPVVVVQETRDPVLPCELRLEVPGLGDPQVVEAEFSRQVRLSMPRVEGFALGHDTPLGETAAVPRVVLRDVVELRKIEGKDLRGLFGTPALSDQSRLNSLSHVFLGDRKARRYDSASTDESGRRIRRIAAQEGLIPGLCSRSDPPFKYLDVVFEAGDMTLERLDVPLVLGEVLVEDSVVPKGLPDQRHAHLLVVHTVRQFMDPACQSAMACVPLSRTDFITYW